VAGRHRMRFVDARVSRGLRPLTVTALCSIVAVLAVLVTQTVHPRGATSGGASAYSAGQGNGAPAATDSGTTDQGQTDDGTPSDAPSTADSSGPAAAPAVPPADPPAPPAAPPFAAPPPPAPAPDPAPGHPTPSPSPSPTPSPAPPPPSTVSYEAEASSNSMPGTKVMSCSGCSGGRKVGDIGKGMGWLRFNGVSTASGGTVMIVIGYVNGGSTVRTAQLSINGGAPITLSFARTADWSTTGWLAVRVTLKAGSNNLEFTNPSSAAPDFDRITVLS
jgi:Alpha-galactosidase, CBM13 domain